MAPLFAAIFEALEFIMFKLETPAEALGGVGGLSLKNMTVSAAITVPNIA